MRVRRAGRATGLALAGLALFTSACGDEGGPRGVTQTGASVEYEVARVVRSFIVAYAGGDSERACGRLTPDHQRVVAQRQQRPSCVRALALERSRASTRELERLRRARITKVDVAGDAARAELRMGSAERAKLLTATLRRAGDGWQITGDLMPGGLESGRVPEPLPGPPRNPEEERRIAGVFERYRDALGRGDGAEACELQTLGARERLVEEAIELLGGESAARREFGALDCERVAVGFEIPGGRIKTIVVDGDSGRLRVEGGASYRFQRVAGEWKLDS